MYSKSIRINKESIDYTFAYQPFYKRADGMLWFEYWLGHDCIYTMYVIVYGRFRAEAILVIFCRLCDVSIGFWNCSNSVVFFFIFSYSVYHENWDPSNWFNTATFVCLYYYSLHYFHQFVSWSTWCCNILMGIVISWCMTTWKVSKGENALYLQSSV